MNTNTSALRRTYTNILRSQGLSTGEIDMIVSRMETADFSREIGNFEAAK